MLHATLEKKNITNSLDRRAETRHNQPAEILTFGNDLNFYKAGVVECSATGARVVLTQDVHRNDIIGVVVQRGNTRIRTFARVAWTTELNATRTVAGLEFLKLDHDLAC